MNNNATAIELRELLGNFVDEINCGKSTRTSRLDAKERYGRYRLLKSVLNEEYPCSISATTHYEKYGGATKSEYITIGDFSMATLIEYKDQDCTTCRAIQIRRIRYGDEPYLNGYNQGKVYLDELPKASEYDTGVIGICQSIQSYCRYIDLSWFDIRDCSRELVRLNHIKSSFSEIHERESEKWINGDTDGRVNDFTMATTINLNFKIQALENHIGYLTRKMLLPTRR